MIEHIIELSAKHRWPVFGATGLLVAWSVFAVNQTPLDAVHSRGDQSETPPHRRAQVSYASHMRFVLKLALAAIAVTGCKGGRCDAARAEALEPWQNLQRSVDQRLAQEKAAALDDAGTSAPGRDDEQLEYARNRFEQAAYWSQRVQVGVMLLKAKRLDDFVPAFEQTVREVSESVHGVNDPQLNASLGPARLAALNALAACR